MALFNLHERASIYFIMFHDQNIVSQHLKLRGLVIIVVLPNVMYDANSKVGLMY